MPTVLSTISCPALSAVSPLQCRCVEKVEVLFYFLPSKTHGNLALLDNREKKKLHETTFHSSLNDKMVLDMSLVKVAQPLCPPLPAGSLGMVANCVVQGTLVACIYIKSVPGSLGDPSPVLAPAVPWLLSSPGREAPVCFIFSS